MIFLVLSIIFMVLLAIVTREAVAAGCNAISFNSIARYFSGLIMLIFTLCMVDPAQIFIAFKAAGWISILGAFLFCVSTIGATGSVKYGPLGISWTILRCSMVISTLASLLYWREIPFGPNSKFILCVAGIILIVAAVIIFGVSKTLPKRQRKKISLKWLLFVSMAFWGQGGWEVLMRSTRSMQVEGFREVFITLVFLFSAVLCTPALNGIARHNWKKELLWGLIFGFCGIFASAMRIWALKEVDGTIVFPATTICVTLAVQVLSILLYREKPGKIDVFGYVLSLAGILCLTLM